MKKIGILASHPIQYQAPLFRELAKHVDLKVYYACQPPSENQKKAGYGISFDWDIDLFSGYSYQYLENISKKPALDRFLGCNTPEIGALIKQEKFDALIVMGWHLLCYWQAIFACRSNGVRVMLRGDGQLKGRRSSLKKILKKIIYPFLFSRIDVFLAVGRRFEDYLRHYGVQIEKIFFSPHCVDNQRFQKESQMTELQKIKIKIDLGIPPGKKVVLFCGRFVEMKRPLDLLKSLDLLVGVHGLFLGAGTLEPVLRQHAAQNHTPVSFAGFVNQKLLPRYYGIADVFVLPSDASETWGLVVNEAMACGIPAIVSDKVGCGPDLIDDGKTGFVYPAGDIQELVCAIEKILEADTNEIKKFICLKIEKYSIANACAGILEAIEGVQ